MCLTDVHVHLLFQGILDNHQCAGQEEAVKDRVAGLEDQWGTLLSKSAEKSQKLKEANQQQQFNTGVKDVLFWLGEVSVKMRFDCQPTQHEWNLKFT